MTATAADVESGFAALVRGELGEERYGLYVRLRRDFPVFHSPSVNAWVLTRFDDVKALLTRDDDFRPLTTGPGAPVYGRSFMQMHGVEHNRKAGIVGRRVRSAGAIAGGLGDVVATLCRETVAVLPHGTPVDLKARFTEVIPLRVLTHLLRIEQTPELVEIYDIIEHGGLASVGDPGAQQRARDTIPRLKALLAPVIDERRRDPGDDIISDLATATYDDAELPVEEVIAMVSFLMIAGVKTTDRVMSNIVRQLALDPGLFASLRAGRDEPHVLTSYVAEALRCFPPVNGTTRMAQCDTEIGGTRVRAGERLLGLTNAANRDERVFDDPEVFDPRRFIAAPDRQFTQAATMLPFGAGPHFCLGARLAANEVVQSLRALMDHAGSLHPAAVDGSMPEPVGFLHYGPPSTPVLLSAPTGGG